MIGKGWIRPSVGLYGAPILFVHKKTGELQMCIDFRALKLKYTIGHLSFTLYIRLT